MMMTIVWSVLGGAALAGIVYAAYLLLENTVGGF
jgi:hypothetical protein